MDKLTLVTGGSRSGKSLYAQQTAEQHPAPRYFLAACRVCDAEMEERVQKHREARRQGNWQTVEEPLDLAGALLRLGNGPGDGVSAGAGSTAGSNAADGPVVLVDCLTIWINNLLYEAEKKQQVFGEEEIAAHCRRLLAACRQVPGPVIFVTGEVGMGIVPENALARLYRDCVGTCNQMMAAAADRVILVSCGLPLTLKG